MNNCCIGNLFDDNCYCWIAIIVAIVLICCVCNH